MRIRWYPARTLHSPHFSLFILEFSFLSFFFCFFERGEGVGEREWDGVTITRHRIIEQEQESIKRSPNFKGISLSCRLIATLYHTKSFNVMKQFFIFTFHGKCTCVKLCFFIFRNYDKRTQVSLVFLYSNIMVNAHIKLCHSWKKISLMPETEFLELFLLYQHLRKQKWNLKNIIRILLLLEMNILRDYISINCFKCQKQNNPTKHCRYEQLRPKTERERGREINMQM